jgi:hypothetical protein
MLAVSLLEKTRPFRKDSMMKANPNDHRAYSVFDGVEPGTSITGTP